MSNDLISRKSLLNDLDSVIAQYNWEDYGVIMDTLTCVRDMVCDQPTAYDIEDIVKQLKKEKERQRENAIDRNYRFGVVNGLNVSIGIVKGGVE